MKVKEESKHAGLKFSIQKTKIIATGPITSWQTDGEKIKTVTDFIFWAPKSLQMVTSHKIKRRLVLERKVMANLDSILKTETLPGQQRSI